MTTQLQSAATITGRADGRTAKTSIAQGSVQLIAFAPSAGPGAPTPPSFSPTSLGDPALGQPVRIEVTTAQGTLRTCNGKACACARTGDVVRLYSRPDSPFPASRSTSFPGLTYRVEQDCSAVEVTSWTEQVITLKPDAVQAPGGRFGVRARSASWDAMWHVMHDRCRYWLSSGYSGPFLPFASFTTAQTAVVTPGLRRPDWQLPGVRYVPAEGCFQPCSALCIVDGAGGCLNNLVVGDGAPPLSFIASNGTPVQSPVMPSVKRQYVPQATSIPLEARIKVRPGFPLTSVTILRGGVLDPAPVTVTVAPDGKSAKATAQVQGIDRKTDFQVVTETTCGKVDRTLTLVPMPTIVVTPGDPIALGPGGSVSLEIKTATPVSADIGVELHLSNETVPFDSDIYPQASLDASSVVLPKDGSPVRVTLSLEDSNTGIVTGTVVARLAIEPDALSAWEWRDITYVRPVATGFVDTHTHPFSHLAFGAFDPSGAPNPRGGAILGPVDGGPDVLTSCKAQHGVSGFDDAFGLIGAGGALHANLGSPTFEGWPAWFTNTHQQMQTEWIKRAHAGGLRVMVALAVENRLLCAIKRSGLTTSDLVNFGFNPFGPGVFNLDPSTWIPSPLAALDPRIFTVPARALAAFTSCSPEDQMRSIQAQFDATKTFVANNASWVQLVTDGTQADQAIRAGKLAIVLGVEMGPLFGCDVNSGARCNEQFVRSQVASFHDQGVRYVYMVHKEDNAFGGASNMPLTPVATQPCQAAPAGCNPRGLTPAGTWLLDAMVAHGWFIDLDHMSLRMRDDVFAYLNQLERSRGVVYPVFAGHASIHAFERADGLHEGTRTVADVAWIRRSGGLFSPILDPGSSKESFDYANEEFGREWSCYHSSDTWAQQLRFAIKHGRGRAVGIGSDFNGFAGLPGPQYGPLRCSSGKGANYGVPAKQPPILPVMVEYPFQPPYTNPDGTLPPRLDRLQVGAHRTYDVNYDGVAHIGLLPDFIVELAVRGSDVEPLMRSADAFARAWRKMDCEAERLRGGQVVCPR